MKKTTKGKHGTPKGAPSNATGKHWTLKSKLAISKSKHLTDKDLLSIFKSTMAYKFLAAKYGVKYSLIYKIKNKRSLYIARLLAKKKGFTDEQIFTFLECFSSLMKKNNK